MTDLLDQLRDENPVELADLDVPERLRPTDAAITAYRSRSRGARWLRAGVVAAAGAVVLLVLGGGQRTERSLAARAVATGTGGGIVHWRTEEHNYVNGRDQEHTRVEGWSRRGVTHVVLSRVLRGRAHVIFDTRSADGRSRTYTASSDDYETRPASSRPTSSPLSFGEDPFETFRRAYRAGTLTKLGPHRYAASLGRHTTEKAIYDIDPATARPVSMTIRTHNANGPRRYDIRFVVRFAAYEQLPFNGSSRRTLKLLAHPGAGPKNDPAARHFAVLRDGPRPTNEQLRSVRRFASHFAHGRLDPSGTRVLRPGLFLIPGNGYVCLVVAGRPPVGIGGGCQSVGHAVQHGLGTGGIAPPGATHRTPVTVVVPDGVRALRARVRGHKTATATVHGNLAMLPGETYAWAFVK